MHTTNQSLKYEKLFLLMLLEDKNGTVVFLLHLGEKCLQFNEILLSLPFAISLLSSHSNFYVCSFGSRGPYLHSHTELDLERRGGGGGFWLYVY